LHITPAMSDSAKMYVARHNEFRCKLCGTPELIYDAQLEADAIAYASTCPSGHADHNARKGMGENLYIMPGFGGALDLAFWWREAIRLWYDEIDNFDRGDSHISGHFKMLAAPKNRYIGCGATVGCYNYLPPWMQRFGSTAGGLAIVCRYKNHENSYSMDVSVTADGKAQRNHGSCADSHC